MIGLLDPPSPSDDDSCIDLEEFTPMCELSLVGFNPGSTLGEMEISQLQEKLKASLRVIREESNCSAPFMVSLSRC